jgi:hypothetical protein
LKEVGWSKNVTKHMRFSTKTPLILRQKPLFSGHYPISAFLAKAAFENGTWALNLGQLQCLSIYRTIHYQVGFSNLFSTYTLHILESDKF